MEWYKIVIGILIWILGVFIYMKYKDFQKNKYHMIHSKIKNSR